jgi:hypothetical protein
MVEPIDPAGQTGILQNQNPAMEMDVAMVQDLVVLKTIKIYAERLVILIQAGLVPEQKDTILLPAQVLQDLVEVTIAKINPDLPDREAVN